MQIPFLMQLTEKVWRRSCGETGFENPALSAPFFTILPTVLLVTPIPLFSAKWYSSNLLTLSVIGMILLFVFLP